MFEFIKKAFDSLPSIRKPDKSNSNYEKFFNNYYWGFMSSNKPKGDFDIYWEAGNNVYVYRSIQVIIDALLANGFSIKSKDETEILTNMDIARRNYLTNIFNNPEGYSNHTFYAIFLNKYMKSFELTGDAFIEVNHDKAFNNIITGFRYLPSEVMRYYPDTHQWGFYDDSYRYETENLIHIYEPDIRMRNQFWGTSKIDKIGLAISLMFLGMKYNRETLDNDGLDPNAILAFDKDISNESFKSELKRLESLAKKKKQGATLAVKGASFQRSGITNRDMDFLEMVKFSRDCIITAFGVPPQKVEIIETASLGTGTGESQNKNFKELLLGKNALIEGAFNKALGHNGFEEVFSFNEMDIEDKLKRSQIESTQLDKGVVSINEVRKSYGWSPVVWGDVPMNYNNFGVAPNPFKPNQSIEQMGSDSLKMLRQYKNNVYKAGLLSEWE